VKSREGGVVAARRGGGRYRTGDRRHKAAWWRHRARRRCKTKWECKTKKPPRLSRSSVHPPAFPDSLLNVCGGQILVTNRRQHYDTAQWQSPFSCPGSRPLPSRHSKTPAGGRPCRAAWRELYTSFPPQSKQSSRFPQSLHVNPPRENAVRPLWSPLWHSKTRLAAGQVTPQKQNHIEEYIIKKI